MKARFVLVELACLLLAAPAMAQTQPLTTEQLQQQNNATNSNSAGALDRAMTQEQLGQIEQQQRAQELFAGQPGFRPDPALYSTLPPGAYVMPPPPAPPPPPPPPPPPLPPG